MTSSVSLISKAKNLIKDNKYSQDSWMALIKDAQELKIEDSREFFEELINQFPTCGRYWKIYIEQELKAKNYDEVNKLFEKCLDKVLHIDLWKCFLAYVKETTLNTPDYKEKLCNAYNLALDKIGLDVMSYSIWLDYVNFFKQPDDSNTVISNDDIDRVRSIYKRGIANPMINVEQFWKDYCAFELRISSANKTLIEEVGKEFYNIKKIAREYENVTRPLERHMPAIPPQDNNEEIKQIYAWKRYIAWEKQNPLKFQDRNQVIKRVMFAYEQSFLCLAYHPDIWCEATNYLYEQSKLFSKEYKNNEASKYAEDASALYERAINTFMKSSTLLHLAYAELEECRLNYDKAKEIYEKCLQNSQLDITLITIQFMRFMRRTKGIKAAREIFKIGREDPRTSYQLYIAAADMEYYCTKDKSVAFKIYHLGAKKFPNNPEFMLSYIKYMSHLNEDNNTRVLFERILSSNELPPKDGTDEIWSEFLKFECYCGDLASVLKVDKKRQKAIESKEDFDVCQNALMIDRYKFLDLLPCNANELKSLGYKEEKNSIQNLQPRLHNSTSFNIGTFNEILGTNEYRAKLKFPAPDETQMLPFKPVRNALPGMHLVPGGIFPFPPAAAELVKKLMPPNLYQGPFVIVEDLMKSILQMEITENFQPFYVNVNGDPIKDLPINPTYHSTYLKRSFQNQADSDEEDAKKPKTMDIYKQRQHKKFTKPS